MCNQLYNYQGIIGTVIGTFLGWFLTKLTQSGRTLFYSDHFELDFFKVESGVLQKNEYDDKTIYGELKFDLDIANTSGNNRMFRNIYCLFNCPNTKIKKEVFDLDTYRVIAQRADYNKIDVLNIQAKSLIKKRILVNLSKEELHNFRNNEVSLRLFYTKLWGIRKAKSISLTSIINYKIKK
jgi:hypothetical protein